MSVMNYKWMKHYYDYWRKNIKEYNTSENAWELPQTKLAELSGINPVSVRKYETNKMMPSMLN